VLTIGTQVTSVSGRTSVIIPVRNGSRFVCEAIDSALAQLAADDEVIVVDDASDDDTGRIIRKIDDPRIRVLDGTGRGVSSARNIGLAAANGEFVAFLDHDDLWPSGRHGVLLQTLLDDPELDCAIGRLRLRMEDDAVQPPRLADMDGRLAANLSLCTALFRRRVIDAAGYFDETLRLGEDTDYFVRLTELNYRFRLCDVDTLVYRRHKSNATCDVPGARMGVVELIRRRRARMGGRAGS
jgi:glycosyltransferase involved in cell wall biosynthesis